MNTKCVGKMGELIAENYLAHRGYKILEKNYRSKYGEVDLIIENYKKEIIFVEVKTRTSDLFGQPQDAIDYNKRQKIIKTALYFLNAATEKRSVIWRLDAIAVKLTTSKKFKEITHIKNI